MVAPEGLVSRPHETPAAARLCRTQRRELSSNRWLAGGEGKAESGCGSGCWWTENVGHGGLTRSAASAVLVAMLADATL
jgi:hypothetical protein